MDCLESRRLLLALPRERTPEQRVHLARCAECSRLAHWLTNFERGLQEAALVPVPDALPARILLAPRNRRRWQHAAAAVLVSVSAALGLFASGILEMPGSAREVDAVGPTHPAVVAIAEVANEEAQATALTPAEEKAEMDQGLRRLGLKLKEGEAIAHYVGKCRIEGNRDCEHIVLSTPDAHANVILVADYPLQERVLVSDRRMVALVSPAGDGAYIVVADSAKTAARMEKLIVKG